MRRSLALTALTKPWIWLAVLAAALPLAAETDFPPTREPLPEIPAYEPFAYNGGEDLDGLDGGIGWASPWYYDLPSFRTLEAVTPTGSSDRLSVTVSTDGSSLPYYYGGYDMPSPDGGHVTTGFSRSQDASIYRDMDFDLDLGGELYFSVLIRPEANAGFAGGLRLFGQDGVLTLGKFEGDSRWGIGIDSESGSSIEFTDYPLTLGETVMLLGRLQVSDEASTTFDLYVNPYVYRNDGDYEVDYDFYYSSAASVEGFGLGSLLSIELFAAGGGYSWDEIRFGTSVEAALGIIPEPGTFGLLAVALGLAGGWAQRRRLRQ